MKNKGLYTRSITRLSLIFLISVFSTLLVSCGGSSSSSGESSDSTNTDKEFSFSASAGVKLDITTGTKTTYSGFDVENIYIVDGEDKQLASNEIPLNSQFSIVYEGLKNYALKDGKAFPGLSLQVTDAAGNDILNEADLLASYTEGFAEADAAVLRGSVTVASPMKAGETYHCKVRAFDKNSNAEIISNLDFSVK